MPSKRCCELAFCHAARLAIVYPSPSRWQYQARLPLFQTLIGCLPANIMEDALLQKPCFHHMYTCAETGSVSCLAFNFSIQKLKKKKHHAWTNFYSQRGYAFPSPHAGCTFQSHSQPWKNTVWLCVLLCHCQTGSADPDDWKCELLTPGGKSLFAVVATENGAKCDLFVEKMRATKVNMHPCASVSIEQWLNVSLVQITVDFGCENFGMHLFHHAAQPLLCLLDSACRSWSLPRNSHLSWMNDFVQRTTFITSSKEKPRLSMINEWRIHQQVMNVQSCEVHLN